MSEDLLPADETPLEDVVLTTRVRHSLMQAEPPFKTVGDLRKVPDYELLRLGNFGRVSLLEVRLLTGQVKPMDISINRLKSKWVQAVYHGRCECSFKEWRKQHGIPGA